jgi:hypothetical protein
VISLSRCDFSAKISVQKNIRKEYSPESASDSIHPSEVKSDVGSSDQMQQLMMQLSMMLAQNKDKKTFGITSNLFFSLNNQWVLNSRATDQITRNKRQFQVFSELRDAMLPIHLRDKIH